MLNVVLFLPSSICLGCYLGGYGGFTGFICWLVGCETGYVGGFVIIGFLVCCDVWGAFTVPFEPSAFHASSKLKSKFFLLITGDFPPRIYPEPEPETCFCVLAGVTVVVVVVGIPGPVPNNAPKF